VKGSLLKTYLWFVFVCASSDIAIGGQAAGDIEALL